jgi:hypothetical protein
MSCKIYLLHHRRMLSHHSKLRAFLLKRLWVYDLRLRERKRRHKRRCMHAPTERKEKKCSAPAPSHCVKHIVASNAQKPEISAYVQVPRNKNCKSSGLKRSIATLSLLTVPAIMAAFFSCSATIRDSTLSSMQRRVMTQGRR